MNYREFVDDFLIPLSDPHKPERAILADLRRGLSDFPHLSPYMHRHIIPHLPVKVSRWEKFTYYLTAALFASHPSSAENTNDPDETKYLNMGHHFARLLDAQNPDANVPIERRFTYLLAAHPDDLYFHLRQAIAYLRSNEKPIPIHWHNLMWDIHHWNNPDKRPAILEKWADAFWHKSIQKKEQPETEIN